MIIIIIIIIIILYIIIYLILNKFNDKFILHNNIIEIIWTIVPITILIFLAIPSLKILYLTDEILKPVITIKIISHQWYWKYEYRDFQNLEFDSFIITYEYIYIFRLLDVDIRIVVPYQCEIRLLCTSNDVIHSWTVPSLGIKVDCIPGRINQTNIYLKRPGLYYGQCSEICGMNHSFIPIVVERTQRTNFINWLKNISKSLGDWIKVLVS